MSLLDLFLAITPLLVVVVGIVGFKKPAMWVSLAALIYGFILSVFYFNLGQSSAVTQTTNGIISGTKMVFMIWAAFLIMNMLIRTGAMDKIKEVLADLTNDKRKQVIIVAFCFGGFLEGVAGAGTPAAIAAPFLVALGMTAIEAAAAALIFNGIAASLGAAGLTTIGGFAAFLEPGLVNELDIGMVTGCIHFFGALVAPLIVMYVLYGKKGFTKDIVAFSIFTGFFYGISLVLVGTFVGAAFPTIVAGVVSLIASIIYVKVFDKKTVIPEEFVFTIDSSLRKADMKPLTALSSYLLLLVILPIVRFFAPDWFIGLGFSVWIGLTIMFVCFLGSIILKSTSQMPSYMWVSFKSVISALVAMASLTALANLMQSAGMLTLIATALTSVVGPFYPAVAVIIGSLGSFVTGTTTGSNIMFAPMHYEASKLLGISTPVVFAASSTGGALGNMICTNNVVAVCTTVNIQKDEGFVMVKVFKPICILWALYGTLAMIYTYLIFPTLGM